MDDLIAWKGRPHKPLVVKGQRQVGKTFILEHFGRTQYSNYVLIDLASDITCRRFFEELSSIDEIVDQVSLYKSIEIVPHETLLIIDEIQESSRARALLKQFHKDGRYEVVATGSLLGVSDSRLGSFKKKPNKDLLPVGSEEHMTMHPLDFDEFLLATGVSRKHIDGIKEKIRGKVPIPQTELDFFTRRFSAYMVVGGMPSAVNAFIEGGMSAAQRELDSIVSTCINDINRYNSGIDIVKTEKCFRSIPLQLSDTNKRFMFSRIDSDKPRDASSKYSENLLWIEASGYGNFSRSLTAMCKPPEKYVDRDVFKVYMSDSGILMNMMGPESRAAIAMGDPSYNFGAVAENTVGGCLRKLGYDLYYYRRTAGKDKMEIDAIIECDGLVAIEVKSGAPREYPSIRKTLGDQNISRRVIFENGNAYVDDDGIEHYPLFASAFLFDRKETADDDDLFRALVDGREGAGSAGSGRLRLLYPYIKGEAWGCQIS